MSLGPWQIALIVLLLLVLFGRGRISEMMGDIGKGIKSFKKGVSDEDDKKDDDGPPRRIEHKSSDGSASSSPDRDGTTRS